MQVKKWNIATKDDVLYNQLRKSTEMSDMVCRVLSARGKGQSLEEINDFFEKQVEFESPFHIKDMDKAVERIHEGLMADDKIAIYGDYDCDGITSTVLMVSYLQSLGADVFYYIPSREKEGYGMNKSAIDKLADLGTNLIITVDNGITSHEEIAYAKERGIDTVITDHHTPRETLPDAVAVLNPHRKDCPSRFKDYAGVGVAFQLVCALEEADPWEMLEYYGDLVTIGTIADLVPLKNENREIVQHGLKILENSGRPGIQALIKIGKISSPLTSESISFGIAPRINAAGRMDRVELGVELLMTDDLNNALEIGENLQQMNLERRKIEEDVLQQIRQQLTEQPEKLLNRVLIVSGENWHQGVMGIVASRLVDRYGKPCIVFSFTDGVAKGSGRSLEGFSLIDAITASSEHLTHYGGHTLAAGVTVSEEFLSAFETQIEAYAKEHYSTMPVPNLPIDTVLLPEELTIENIASLDALAPFGSENPSPIFLLKDLVLDGIFPTADNKHMRLKFKNGNGEIMAIYFRMSPNRFPYKIGDALDAVVDVDINEWNGNLQLSIKIKDIRPSDYPEEEGILAAERYRSHKRAEYGVGCKKEDLIPSREDYALLYRYLRQQKGYIYGPVALWEELYKEHLDLAKVQISLDVFEEAGLIQRQGNEISLIPTTKKVDLEQTKIIQNLI